MFATRYFPARFYAPRYFPKVGAEPPVVTTTDVDETDASHFLRRPASTMHRTHSAHNAGSHYGISALPFWQWRLA